MRQGRPVVVMLLGRARLHLPARPRGADRRAARGQRPARQLRTARRRRRRRAPLRRRCASRSGSSSTSAGRPAGRTVGRATFRRGRATSATRAAADLALARSADVAVGPHARPTRSRRSSTGWRPRPSRRALLGMVARDGALVRPLLVFTREETGAYCTRRTACAGATTRATTRRPTRATASAASSSRRCERVHPAAEENVLALAEILRAEAEVLDELVVGRRWTAGRDPVGAAARAAAGAAAAGGAAPCRRRGRGPGRRGGPPRRGSRGDAAARQLGPGPAARGSARRPRDGVVAFGRTPKGAREPLGRTATRQQGRSAHLKTSRAAPS